MIVMEKRWNLISSLQHVPIISTQMFGTNNNNEFQAIITLICYTDKNSSMEIKFPILSQRSKVKLSEVNFCLIKYVWWDLHTFGCGIEPKKCFFFLQESVLRTLEIVKIL